MKNFKLDDHDKINPGFNIPEGYFDQLPQQIQAKIANQPKVIPLHRKKNIWFAAAAVLVVGLGITVFNALKTQSNETDAIAIENYLASQTGTEDALVELLENEDLEQLNAEINLDDKAVEDILSHNANLEQYLIN
ncbi:hypothetical protein [Flavobacterium sp.]|uniref:hypothetical protein n=1 Tax=Flavobacterium sp. TaxID=239 RepID=UPI0039E45668